MYPFILEKNQLNSSTVLPIASNSKSSLKLILTFLIIFAFSSCDSVYHVILRNYGKESKITARYANDQRSAWHDNDTLIAKTLDSLGNTFIIRNNIDSTSYSVKVPGLYQIELHPKSLGTPIKSISYKSTSDSTVIIKLWGDDWKKLKKEGVVETKGFLFYTNTILINKLNNRLTN